MPNLCTLSDVKAWLGITDSNSDTLLNRLISSQSEAFLNETRRQLDFAAADYAEQILADSWKPVTVYSRPASKVFPRHYPINSIASVKLNGVAVTEVTDPSDLSQSGFWFDDTLEPESLNGFYMIGYQWPAPQIYDPSLIVLTVGYNAGYSSIPASVAQAVIEWVAFKRGESQIQALDQSSGSFTIGDYSESQSASSLAIAALAIDIPGSVKQVIEKYTKPLSF